MGRLRPLFGNRPWAVRRLQPQRSMGSVAVVIVHVLPQDGAEMPLVDHDAMVEAFAPQRADTPFGDGVGLRSADGCENRPDPEAGGARDEVAAVTGVAVSDQIARPLAPRGRLEDLLPDPGRRGMPGDVPVLDAPHAGLRLRRRLAARDARHRAADAGTRAFLVRHRQPGPVVSQNSATPPPRCTRDGGPRGSGGSGAAPGPEGGRRSAARPAVRPRATDEGAWRCSRRCIPAGRGQVAFAEHEHVVDTGPETRFAIGTTIGGRSRSSSQRSRVRRMSQRRNEEQRDRSPGVRRRGP